MRLFLILLLSIQIFANDLVDAVVNFNEQNIKIYELSQLLSNDEDKSINKTKIDVEINDLKAKKTQILAVFPTFINSENLSKELLKDVKKEKNTLDLKKAKESFYECLLAINNNFASNDENNIKNIIDEYLKEIKSIESKNDIVVREINSYVEILTYLRLNANIFDSNYIFTKLDTNEFLNKFNNLFSDSINSYINPGKIIVCIGIMGFIFLFKKMLLKLLFFIILKFSNNEHTLSLLSSLTKPIVVIFYIYGLWLCVIVSFYPAPIMPIFVMIFGIINTIIATWFVLTALNSYGMLFISKLAQKSNKKEIINLMMKILYFIIIFIAILVILSKIGFDISTIIASLGIGGLAVALATKDIIANFFASVLTLFDNSFSQGDWVVVDEVEGTVVETGLRKTAIRTFDNSIVFVPNSKIMNANIKNWSRRKLGRKIGLTIGVEYNVTTEQLKAILEDIRTMLKNHKGIAQPQIDNSKNTSDFMTQYRQNMVSVDDLDGYKNTLFVYLNDFSGSSIDIVIYCFSKTVVWGEFLKVKEDVMLKVMQILEKHKASFAFPSTSVYIEKMPEDKHLNLQKD